jgi:hypothetical protein
MALYFKATLNLLLKRTRLADASVPFKAYPLKSYFAPADGNPVNLSEFTSLK